MRFREITKSVAIDLPDKQAVVDHIAEALAPWPSAPKPTLRNVTSEYSHESAPTHEGKPGWGKVWIVTLRGYGVIGFADAPLDPEPSVARQPERPDDDAQQPDGEQRADQRS